ncbi:MAG: transglycosylase domain-containing protein, partial [Chloroflexota bacterium]
MKRTPVKDRRQRKARGSSGRTTILLSIVVVFSVLGILLVAAPFALAFAAYSYAAGALNSLSVTSHQATFQTSRIYDRNGKLLYEFVDPTAGRRTEVPLQQIPVSLRDATIAIEDKTFYTNPGFDVNGILRATYDDIAHHSIVSGASTITEQLVKQVYLTPAVNFQRKLKEVAIAYTLSKEKTKDQILEMYLNQIFYGNDAVGIEAAAESYFGIPAIKLDLAQSALLAGLPQSPTAYDPLQNLQRAKVRQLEVLNQMVDQGYVTDQQAQSAYNEKLNFAKQTQVIQAPHFVFYVRDLLEQKYGARSLYQGGLRITTTLDLTLQNQAQQIVQTDLSAAELNGKNVNNAAVVAIDPHTGEILAMVGSRDYNQEFPNGTMDGKFNAALAPLQPGSSFKPFAYVTDFLKGRTAATIWDDSKVTDEFPNFDGTYYRPADYDGKYHGKVTSRVALANSLNVPAVKVLKDATIHSTLQTAHAMGISTINDESQVGLSLVLGGNAVTLLDMTSAYGVFANQGARVPAQAIPV